MKLKDLLEAAFVKDPVYFEGDGDKFYIINIETKEQDTYNSKYYHVWWEGQWSGNKHLVVIANSNHQKIKEYWNVHTELGNKPTDFVIGLDTEIKSMKTARNFNKSNDDLFKVLKQKRFKEYKGEGSPDFKGKQWTNEKLVVSIPDKNKDEYKAYFRDFDEKNGTTLKTVKTLEDFEELVSEKNLKGVLQVLKRLGE